MLLAAMRPWRRPVFFVFFLPLGLAILSNCHRMLQELLWKKELVVAVDSHMFRLAIFQILTGIFIFCTMVCLCYVVFSRRTGLLQHALVYQQISTFICIAIIGLIIFTRYPSMEKDEKFLNTTMSGYGKDESMTKKMDSIQSELKCCGVTGFTDWKRFNATFIVPSLSYEYASKVVAIVPFTCAAINETSVRFHTGGCLIHFFAFKEHISYRLLMNVEILVIFEMYLLFLIGCIIVTDTMESNEVIYASLMHEIIDDLVELDAAANAERKHGDDVPSIDILDDAPPMPLEA